MKIFIFICAFFLTTIVIAQHTIKGIIVDDANIPLKLVTVALLYEDSVFVKGTTTDKTGAFELKEITSGNYILSLSSIGYDSLVYTVFGLSRNMDLGTIILGKKTLQLNEVLVSAAESITKSDKRLLFPSGEQIAHSENSIVLLSYLMIPRLIVNLATNSVSLPGNEIVELRINNVVVGNDEVRALPPNTIERIEYFDNPGLRYGNSNIVINYITKRHLSGGNVRMELNHSLVRLYGNDLLSSKINFRKSELGLSYGNDFRDYYNYRRNNLEEFHFDDYNLKRLEESQKSRNSNIYQNIVLNYNLNDVKTFLNVSMKYQMINAPHEDYNSLITMSDNPVSSIMKDSSFYYVHLPSLDFYLEQTLTNKQKISVNIVTTNRYQNTIRKYEEINDDSSYALITHLTSNAYSIIGEGIYENILRKGKLNIGLRYFQKWTNNDYLMDKLSNSSMQQSETYIYSEYTGNIRNLNYTIGIGGKRSYYLQNNNIGKYSYYNVQPTLNLLYRIMEKGSFRYRLNIYNDVPTLAQLTDVDVLIDSLQIRRGNPALKPGMTYNNTVLTDYNFNNLYLSLQAMHWYSSNFIQENSLLEDKKVIRTYMNSGNFQRLTFNLYSRLALYNKRLILSANYGIHRFTTSNYFYSVPYYSFNAQFIYKNWQLYGILYDQGAGFTGEVKYIYGTGNYLGVQYQKKNYVISILLSNILIDPKMTTENISKIAPYTKSVYERDKMYAFSLKYTMNFDFGRKFSSGYQKITNSDSGANTLGVGK